MIRPACAKDIPEILALLIEAHDLSETHKHTTYDYAEAERNMTRFVTAVDIFTWVVDDDGIKGVLVGVTIKPWDRLTKTATDIEFYVNPRGHGIRLWRKFEEWAWGFDAVEEIQPSITYGGDDGRRTADFYERIGYEQIGHILRKRKER